MVLCASVPTTCHSTTERWSPAWCCSSYCTEFCFLFSMVTQVTISMNFRWKGRCDWKNWSTFSSHVPRLEVLSHGTLVHSTNFLYPVWLRLLLGLQHAVTALGLLPRVVFLRFTTIVSGPYIRLIFRVQWEHEKLGYTSLYRYSPGGSRPIRKESLRKNGNWIAGWLKGNRTLVERSGTKKQYQTGWNWGKRRINLRGGRANLCGKWYYS
jgi:hypothetical protein